MNPQPERYLIVRLSALGDIIHTLPVLAALRRARPEAEIDWLVEPLGAKLILNGHPGIDCLFVVPKKEMKADIRAAWRGPMRELGEALRQRQYAVTIDGQGLTKSAFWAWRSGASRRVGFAGRESRELATVLNNVRIRPPRHALHVIHRNLSLLKGLGIEPPDDPDFPVHIPPLAGARATEILGGPGAMLAIVTPGAGWATKRWATGRFGELARRMATELGARVAVAWGPGEETLASELMAGAGASGEITETFPPGPGVYRLPLTSFLEMGALIQRARLFVGGDTGPTHLAAALGTPTLSMMGPLDARRNGPLGLHCHTIQHAIPRRAPLWANHRQWCDPATSLDKITVEEMFAAAKGMWEG